LLKIIDSNTFLREKFHYFIRELKAKDQRSGANKVNFDAALQQKASAQSGGDSVPRADNVKDMKEWFVELNRRITPDENQKEQ